MTARRGGRVRSLLSRARRLPFPSRARRARTVDGVTTTAPSRKARTHTDTPAADPRVVETGATPDDPAIAALLAERLGAIGDAEALIGLDVDGTLVDHHGNMTARLHTALQGAARGHHVVIATGRSIGATVPIVRAAGIERGFAVCSNGGVTLEITPDEADGYRVIDVRSFTPREALVALREVAPGAGYAVESPDGSFHSTGEFQDASFGVRATPLPFEELAELDAVRVVVHDPDLSAREFSEIVRSSGVHGVEYAIGTTAWLDMAAPGVSKATALEAIRARLDVDAAHTVAVGDGFNDIEMLRWAATGVAMGQALPRVHEAADVTTATVWADGTAMVLDALARD
ncbi:HAD family hydrolase [Brachybacterium huguangmaarense]